MLLVVARSLFVACALSGFGAALFALTMPIARDVDSRLHASMERQVRKIMSMSLAGALVVGYAWLLLETHAVAGTTDLAQTVTAIPTVLFDTRFGQILVLQALLIVCALAVVWRGAGHFGRFACRHCRNARSWAQPCLRHGAHSLAAVADAAPDSCRRLARRAASWCGRHRSMLRILPLSASLPSVRSQSACLPPPRFFRDAAFGRTCGTHRHGLRRGVAIESRLVRSVDRDRRRQSFSLDAGVRRTGRREG